MARSNNDQPVDAVSHLLVDRVATQAGQQGGQQ